MNLIYISFAGTPPIIEYGGNDLVTTAPADTTLPCPMVTPFNIVTLAPHHTSSSITIGRSFSESFSSSPTSMMNFPTMSILWSPVIMVGFGPKMTLRPIVHGAFVQ